VGEHLNLTIRGSWTFLTVLRSLSKLLRTLAQEKDIGLARVHKAVPEKLNCFPYKVTAVLELKPFISAQ
jgi:hypothetical protein